MRTLIVLAIGIVAAFGFVYVSKAIGRGSVSGALDFICVWLIYTAIDYGRGVKAGYSPLEELGIHLLIFTIPAFAAWLAARWIY